MRFETIARRNKLLGLWTARQLGKSGAEAESYAGTAVMAYFEGPPRDNVIRKVVSDLNAAGVKAEHGEVRRVLDAFTNRATDEIKAGI